MLMRGLVVMIVVFMMAFGILIYGMLTAPPSSPYELLLDAEEMPGDWSITDQEDVLITWDRQGGHRVVNRAYNWSGAQLYIEVTEYFASERAGRTYPMYTPPEESKSVDVEIGEKGEYWAEEGTQFVHYLSGAMLVYSWLENDDDPELDKDWFLNVMELEELNLLRRA